MKKYNRIKLLKEDFVSSDVERAIELTCKALSKRIGQRVYPSYLPDMVIKASGLNYGFIATIGNDRQIRFNFGTNSVSSNSTALTSVDVWRSLGFSPDLTVNTEGISIVKAVPAIVAALETGIPQTIALEEDMMPKTGGNVSKDIAQSITAWSTKMGVDDDKLRNTRLADLYKDYLYWYSEVSDREFKQVPFPTFRNYVLAYMKQYKIQNIFMRGVSIDKASKEKLTADKKDKEEFDSSIYELSLADKMDFIKQSVMAVVRGYENALIIAGQAGIGKTSTVRTILEDEKVSAKWLQGSIKNYGAAYKFFYDHKNELIIADDTDDLFKKQYVGLMNAIMAPEKKRLVSFPAEFGKELPRGYKDEFQFTGKIIIITNLSKKKIAPSILSRGAVIEVKVNPAEVIDYIRQNISNVMTDYKQATDDIKLEVLDFIEKVKRDILHIDFRLFKRCCIYRLSGNPNWKKFCIPILKAV